MKDNDELFSYKPGPKLNNSELDKISNYHFYMYKYFNQRKIWRNILYDWTRREKCNVTAEISPDKVLAGVAKTITIKIKPEGKSILKPGSRIAVYFPLYFGGNKNKSAMNCFHGMDGRQGYGSKICATSDMEDCKLKTQVHSTGSVFTCVEIIVKKGIIQKGNTIKLYIGHPSSKPQVCQEKAKNYPFRIAVDFKGNDEFKPVKDYPVLRIVGNSAVKLSCHVSRTPDQSAYTVRINALDEYNHNLSYHYRGKIHMMLQDDSGIEEIKTVQMKPKDHGTLVIRDVNIPKNGVSYIQVIDREKAIMGKSNPICDKFQFEDKNIFFGEIHSHTELSDGVGTVDDNFKWAKNVEGLDFSALADHFEDGQSYNYTLEDKWRITKEAVKKYNQPDEFVTLLGYEIGTLERHRNVYFKDDKGRLVVEGRGGEKVTMDNVYDKLEGTDYILIPHAPKFHGINWYAQHVPKRQRLVEICSSWGISEQEGPLSVRHALDLGYKFGFTGGTDSHTAEPAHSDWRGLTGVYAKSLSREGIFNALMNKNTYATTGTKMLIKFTINNRLMGSDVKIKALNDRIIDWDVVAESRIKSIEIIRNGEVFYKKDEINKYHDKFRRVDTDNLNKLLLDRELTDEKFAYYYLKVITEDEQRGWSSPLWISLQQ